MTRSFMAADIHGLLYGLYNTIYIRKLLDLKEFYFDIHGLSELKTLFNVVKKDALTLDKKL